MIGFICSVSRMRSVFNCFIRFVILLLWMGGSSCVHVSALYTSYSGKELLLFELSRNTLVTIAFYVEM